jgi:O-antigen ligase
MVVTEVRPGSPAPRTARTASRSGHPLAGVAAATLMLATSRWGAYIGISPFFLTDALLATGLLLVLVRRAGSAVGRRPPASRRGSPGPVALLLLVYVLVRFAAGRDHSLLALRDFAPYGYVAVAFVSAGAYRRSTGRDRALTMTVVSYALLFHLGWVCLVRLLPTLPDHLPVVNAEQDIHIFSLRGSTDLNLVGVTAAVYLGRYVRTGRWRYLMVAGIGVALVLGLPARAALLGTAVAIAVSLVVSFTVAATSGAMRDRRLAAIGLLPLVLVVAALLFPTTTGGGQLLSGLGVTPVSSDLDVGGVATVQARKAAWHLVLDYLGETHSGLFGVGFGPDFLYESGARVPLGNSAYLRSPHNYLLGSYARLGVVGLVLLGAVTVGAARLLVVTRRLAGTEEILLFASCYAASVFTTALFGVELEAPFCAVPFFWCLGVLLSRPTAAAPAG